MKPIPDIFTILRERGIRFAGYCCHAKQELASVHLDMAQKGLVVKQRPKLTNYVMTQNANLINIPS